MPEKTIECAGEERVVIADSPVLDQTFIGNAQQMDLWPRNALTGDWNAPELREPVADVATGGSESTRDSIFAGHDLVDLLVDIGERLRAPFRTSGADVCPNWPLTWSKKSSETIYTISIAAAYGFPVQ